MKTQENALPNFIFEEAEEAKIWWNLQVQCRTRSLALSDHGSHCIQEEWLKELKDTSPASEAEGQNTTRASCTKLLENRRDSETSTTRESSADVDVDNADFEISSFWVSKSVWRMKKPKLEQHNTNATNEIF